MQYLAIYKQKMLAQGSIEEIIKQVKKIDENIEPIVMEVSSFKRIELNWHGDVETVLNVFLSENQKVPNKRGRPKLGVISKEVTLLPRHWEWLATQRGGASVALRRLVDEAKKNATTEDIICLEQKRLDEFMMTFLGDESGFEEASRSLYRNSRVSFESAIQQWPEDIKEIVMEKFNYISALHNGEVEK